jgi:hypothetical protein
MSGRLSEEVSAFWWNYILAPPLSLLPARWRAKWFENRAISWRRATILSGSVQFLLGPVALLVWYSFLIGGWATRLVDFLLRRAPNVEINEPTLGFLGLSAVALHPVTWLIFYLFVEGAGRAMAAWIGGEVNGTLPLVLLDRGYLFVRQKFWPSEPPLVADLVTFDEHRADWQLKIESSRIKQGWGAGRLLRYEDRYFRIESVYASAGARPFIYALRELEAGVPSRSVILYPPTAGDPRPLL